MDTIGKYKLVRVIGEGGMGQVYEAIDPVIGRRVAIKTISLSVATDAETRARFFREAQAAGQLSHPNLITIHDIGDQDGTPYIVMEFLEGMDLNRKIRQERLSYDAKIQIMIDVCEGLSFAHGNEIVHRDIKPANIFITSNGRAKILDFGLARGALSDVTQTGKIVGTPNYMSPEQIRGDDVDHRSDIFATGVVFYELLSGRKAFEGDSVATTLYKVLESQPQPLHLLDEQLPPTISSVIERALAKDRLARYQTSGEMLNAVLHAHGQASRADRSNPITMPARPAMSVTPAPARRDLATIAAWSIGGLAIAGVAVFVLIGQRQRNTEVPSAAVVTPLASTPIAATATAPVPTATPEPAPPPAPPPVAPSLATKAAKAPPPKPVPAVQPAAPERTPAPPPAAVAPQAETKVAPPPAPTPAPVAAAPTESKATTERPTPAAAPAPAAAPPPPAIASPPAVVVAPPAAAPARTEESPLIAIQAVLGRYRAALESRDIGALKRIWPALSGRQEDAIRNEFEYSQAIAVGLDGIDIRPAGNSASLTCRRSYAVTTADGQTLRTATRMFMTLSRRDGAWSIESIRHEVAR